MGRNSEEEDMEEAEEEYFKNVASVVRAHGTPSVRLKSTQIYERHSRLQRCLYAFILAQASHGREHSRNALPDRPYSSGPLSALLAAPRRSTPLPRRGSATRPLSPSGTRVPSGRHAAARLSCRHERQENVGQRTSLAVTSADGVCSNVRAK